jgi:hypothetical protein
MSKYVDAYQEERIDIQKDYHKEIHWIAKRYNCHINDIKIDPYHPTGEVCIFIKGVWYGYIDIEFYKMMDGLQSIWDEN